MEKRKTKMLLAILMIVTVLATDFFVLGSGIITYASQLSSETTNTNIEFSAYFKDGENRNVDAIKKINDEDVRMYAEIKVKNEGYLKEGTIIELENSNFNLKNQIFESNTHINSIEGNKVNLKQINNGDIIELELGIEPIRPDRITTDFLSKTSTVKMIGTYVYSQAEEGESIQAEKLVSVNYQPEEITTVDNRIDLETEIITNQVLAVNGVNKKIVQLLIKSRLKDNEYPVEQTTLNVSIPQLSKELEEVNVMAIDQLATNGLTEISSDNYTIDGTTLQIVLKNEPDSSNEINWVKNSYDELIVTFTYPEITELTQITTAVDLEIKAYGATETYTAMLGNGLNSLTQPNNVIMGRTEITTEEIYKGPIYANIDTEYETETKLIVTKENIVEEITIEQGPDSFGTTDSELEINTKYVETEINVNKLLEIVGQDGNIEIKNGENTTLINKETPVDENGNVVIDHGDGASTLTITTSYPVKAGVLEMRHKKIITGNSYTREQLQQVKTLIAKETIVGTKTVEKEKQVVVPKTTETATLELKETISKAQLTIENNKQILSTTEENEVILGVTLVTAGPQYDLYKNPTISLKFPAAVEDVQLKSTPATQNMSEFTEVNVGEYDSTNRIMQIEIKGEQTTYPTSEVAQAYMQIGLNIVLSKLATDTTDKIVMAFANDNATQYIGGRTDGGIIEKTIQISAQQGLQKIFNLNSNENKSQTEAIKQRITSENVGQTLTFETLLINNTGSDMNNVRILGKLPTTGNLITGQENANTFETILAGVNAQNATIYYTTNANATVNETDSWTEDPTNAKMYMINLGTLSQGSNYSATVNVQIPEILKAGLTSYTEYTVIYDNEYGTNIEEVSRSIGLITTSTSDLDVKLTAQVGQELIGDGDVVKEGEVIKYIVTLTNYSESIMENITLKAGVPEGTVIVDEIDNYEYFLNKYYEEKTELNEMNVTIPSIPVGETQTQYEVRVSKGTANTEILNKVAAIFNNVTTESEEMINKIEEANIRVTIKKAMDEAIKLTAGSETQYDVIIENLSSETVNGLALNIISDDFTLQTQDITIGEIPANGTTNLKLKGIIKDTAEKMHISVNVSGSNNTYRSNVIIEELIQADATISLTTPQNNAYLKAGDEVQYNIVVENTGNVSEYYKVYYAIPSALEIQTININGTTISSIYNQSEISNLIYEGINLEVGAKVTIDINAKVKYVEDTKVITNSAKVEVLNVYKNTSQKISHILLPESATQEEIKNIINGFAWLDINGNGQKDSGETALEGITVRVYDTLTNKYLTNEFGVVKTTTDSNGEYVFTQIPNGEYMIVFEYDTNKYEPTTYLAEGTDSTVNSKALTKNITVKDEIITVTGTEIIQVQDHVGHINIGMIEKTIMPPVENIKKSITGHAWLDANGNGQKDDEETLLSGIKVKLYSTITNNYVLNSNGNILETITNNNGEYFFTNIEKGTYIVIFEYETEKYEPTTYLAEGVDTTKNSKAIVNKIELNGVETEVTSTDMLELENDITDINIGLKEKTIVTPGEDDEGNPDDGEPDGGQPDGGNPDDGNNDNENKEEGKVVSGLAWLDANRNGQKDVDENILTGIKVKIYDINTEKYLTDNDGKIIETSTDANGKYIFNNIKKGKYILIFEYDTEEYEPTISFANGVDTTQNSKVVLKKTTINGEEKTYTVTNQIDLQENMLNINIGLKEKIKFDLELNKYVSRIVVQTSKGTKAYDYDNKTLSKVEIHRKQIQGALVVLEYTVKVKNNGDTAGYAKNIVDYLPKGLTFSSELNKDWYLSGENLYTNSLENVEIVPGEEKEIKLILTKTMTAENVGLINNSAEIYKDYNQYGEADIDSTPNNQNKNEDDYGVADAIIQIATGGSIFVYIMLLIANLALIVVAIKIMIQNNIIKISTKDERR